MHMKAACHNKAVIISGAFKCGMKNITMNRFCRFCRVCSRTAESETTEKDKPKQVRLCISMNVRFM